MMCPPFDLREYFLKELNGAEQAAVESHLRTCAACREQLAQLRATEAALFSLRDEEIPQRIAFVSDKIFEPSPLRRWLTAFWGSTARLGFASAAMLSVAIAFSAWHRAPAPAPGTGTIAQTIVPAQSPTLTPEQIDRRIEQAVVKAVADVEARSTEQNRLELAQFRREAEDTRRQLILAAAELDKSQRRNQLLRTMALSRPDGGEEAK
ncbi:MAG: zf-HC2 domain-containing protein [Acidobacteria bacterium]|nr:zf-HC2 domain-containing protein [Acidobacteriota bacterium]